MGELVLGDEARAAARRVTSGPDWWRANARTGKSARFSVARATLERGLGYARRSAVRHCCRGVRGVRSGIASRTIASLEFGLEGRA